MNDTMKVLNALGQFERAQDAQGHERIVVRLVGKRYGTASGWMHWTNWAVITPNFVPDQWFVDGVPNKLPDKNLALVIDFYVGEWLLVGGMVKGQSTANLFTIHQGTIQ